MAKVTHGCKSYNSFFNVCCRNENRCWVIHADYDQVVYLDSVSFDLEDNCYSATSGDRVNIYDGDSGKLIVCPTLT